VKLGLTVSNGTIKHGRYLIMLKTLHIVKNKDEAVTGW
jgi:hypothetical protein